MWSVRGTTLSFRLACFALCCSLVESNSRLTDTRYSGNEVVCGDDGVGERVEVHVAVARHQRPGYHQRHTQLHRQRAASARLHSLQQHDEQPGGAAQRGVHGDGHLARGQHAQRVVRQERQRHGRQLQQHARGG